MNELQQVSRELVYFWRQIVEIYVALSPWQQFAVIYVVVLIPTLILSLLAFPVEPRRGRDRRRFVTY